MKSWKPFMNKYLKAAIIAGLILLLMTAVVIPGSAETNNIVKDYTAKQSYTLSTPETMTICLYFIKDFGTDFYLVPEYRKITVSGSLYKHALEELIKGPSLISDTYFPLPSSVKVYSVVVEDGIAYPNFSDEIYQANVGSLTEGLTLSAIANTLTEFEEINGVYPLVNGNPIDSLGGHILVEEPLVRDESVIK